MTTETNSAAAPVWGVVTVPLMFPLMPAGAQPIASITLREPDAEMLEKIEALGLDDKTQMKTAQSRQIIGLLSGIDPEHLKRLNLRDLAKLGDALGPLLGGEEEAPKT